MLIIAIAALSLVAGAPPDGDDTPLEPIESSTVEAARLLDGEMSPGLCERFGDSAADLAVLRVATPRISEWLGEMVLDYWVDDFEDRLGANQALSPEAENALEAWITSCME